MKLQRHARRDLPFIQKTYVWEAVTCFFNLLNAPITNFQQKKKDELPI